VVPKPLPKQPKPRPRSLRQKQLGEIHDKDVARIFDRTKHKPQPPRGVWGPGRPIENSGMEAHMC